MGPVNYQTSTDLVGFDVGDLFVCGDHVTDLPQPTLEVPAVTDSAIWGTFIVSATNDVNISLSFEEKSE